MKETIVEKQLTPLEKLELREQKLLIEKKKIIKQKKDYLKRESIKQEQKLINFLKQNGIFTVFMESEENKKVIFGGILHSFNSMNNNDVSELNKLKSLVNKLNK